MNLYRHAFYVLVMLSQISFMTQAETPDTALLLDQAISGSHRSEADRARDMFRHPRETLLFFGLRSDMTVVEIWPSRGWYTTILAPALRERGVYYAAGFATSAQRTPDWRKDMQKGFEKFLRSRPDLYGKVIVTELSVPERVTIAAAGSADMVLTFRNVHNWMNGDYAGEMFRVMARTLKPGGVLGVVEHRAAPGTSAEEMKLSGYVTEAHVIELARQAGLRLDARSEINANPRDRRDHPAGVWTLPPSLRYCNRMEDENSKLQCIEQYMPIGESDRMTLRFLKPN